MKQNFLAPIIIIGVPRSGCSLLRFILDCHTQIAAAPDAEWIIEGYANFSMRELSCEINSEFSVAMPFAGTTPNVVARDAAKDFLNTIFSEYLVKRNKKYLVVKAFDDIAFLEFIFDLFPDSTYIHIFRDGRDVACSTPDSLNPFSGENITGGVEINFFTFLRRWYDWENKIRILLQDRKFISISYEQLVNEPSKIIQGVLSFLDLPFEEQMIQCFSDGRNYNESDAPSNNMCSARDMFENSPGRWKTEIKPENFARIDVAYGRFFDELGYERCREVKNEFLFSNDLDTKKFEQFAVQCENEIFSIRELEYKNSLQINNLLRSKQDEIDYKDKLLIQRTKDVQSKEEQILNLHHEIDAVKPSLYSQLEQKTRTIQDLQNILQNQDELLTRTVSGKSFKLGRFLTSPSRFFSDRSSDEIRLQQILLRKKRFVNLGDQLKAGFGNHRSGWTYALACLAPINRPDSIYLDAFIERTFVWKPGEITPTLKPWIGFIHVPPNVPAWFQSEQSNDAIFQTKAWQESFPYCKGLFTLSNYHKKNLESKLNIPINALLHPTEFPAQKWQYEKFILNAQRKIVQIGWWLRKLHAIFELPASDYEKVLLRVSKDAYFYKIFHQEYLLRKQSGCFENSMYDSVRIIEFLKNDEYDQLLSENIMFVDLYDSSANNLVIECIARDAPLLINPLEPVVEYLGKDYPFYFRSYEEAIEKAQNLDLVEETHNYLKNLEIKQKLTGEYFLQSFTNSEILNNCQ